MHEDNVVLHPMSFRYLFPRVLVEREIVRSTKDFAAGEKLGSAPSDTVRSSHRVARVL
jgi:hypothetical protein